jgi:hypothetical protein
MKKHSRLLSSLLFSLIVGVIPFVALSATSASSFHTTQAANIGAPECSDGVDNDGDTLVDFPADSGCGSVNGISEGVPPSPQCSDSIDNDGDTLVDFPADPGCSGASDSNETDIPGGGGAGDITPPSIAILSPADNAVNISSTTTLIINFTEPVVIRSGNIKIKEVSTGSTMQTIAITDPYAILFPNSQLTITLSTPHLLSETSYYVELDGGIVSDTKGNLFAGLFGAASWNFTTGGDGTPPQISNITAIPQATFSNLSWTTNEFTISSFFWGTTADYSTGAGTETTYSLYHTTTLVNLSPSTLYYYSIEARDAAGNKGTATGSFTTLPSVNITPPTNPSLFTATGGADSITLSWMNPPDPNFDAVKIMRSTTGYPRNPRDGSSIYEGTAKTTPDGDVSLGIRYYYTIFARDTSLNYSSGAIASAIITSKKTQRDFSSSPVANPPIPPHVGPTAPPLSIPYSFPLTFSDFNFFERSAKTTQKNTRDKRAALQENEVVITENNGLKISLRPEKTPLGASMLIVSIQDMTTRETSSYLLSKNGTEYEGVIPPLKKGRHSMTITIYDSHNELLNSVTGAITVSTSVKFLPDTLSVNLKTARGGAWLFGSFFLFIISLIFLLLWKRKRENK